nr:SCAN domain-containing protein 3-like [Procambarus clarkii]
MNLDEREMIVNARSCQFTSTSKKIDDNPEPAKPIAVGEAADARRKGDVSNQDGAASQDLTEKKPFTELKNVVLPCLEVAADLIHGGKDAVKKEKQIPLSDTTISRRSVMLADDLKEQLVKKVRLAASFGIQLDETTDIEGEAQQIVYSRLSDLQEKTIVEHYLWCLQLAVETTAHNIFQKLHDFIIEEGIDWEMLVGKRLNEARNAKEKSDFELLLDVVKIVNHICAHAKKHRMFRELCKDMEANFTKLLLHIEVRWLSRGKVLNRVYALREQLCVFFIEEANPMAVKC